MAQPTYTRVSWKNFPNETTPLTAENLNKMDEGIYKITEASLGWAGEEYPSQYEILVGYGEEQTAMGSGVSINDVATKNYVDTAVSARASITDYGNGIIGSTDPNFTIDYQHTVRIGKIVFVHFTFTLASQIQSGIYQFAQITNANLYPNHDHGTIICGYNGSMTTSSALRTDSAVIKTDGRIFFRAVASGTSSNFSYDVSCFYSLTDSAFNTLN